MDFLNLFIIIILWSRVALANPTFGLLAFGRGVTQEVGVDLKTGLIAIVFKNLCLDCDKVLCLLSPIGSIISTDKEINENVEHRIRVGWLK